MNEYMKRLMSKASALHWDDAVEAAPVTRDQENTVKHDTFDEIAYGVLQDTVPAINKAVRRLSEEFDYVRPAYGDLFYMLFQGDPMFNDKAAMLDGYEQNLPLMKYVRASEEVNDLRQGHTIFDEYGTAFAMLGMEDSMREAFERTKAAREAVEAAKELLKQMKQALQDALQGGFPTDVDGVTAEGPASPQDLLIAIEGVESAEDGLGKAEADLDEISKAAAEEIAEAAKEAADDLDQQNELTSSYGIGPGQLARMSFQERRDLVEKLDGSKMAALADLCGPMREYGDAERRRPIKHVPGMHYDVTAGNDITKMMTSELTLLGHEDLEDLWLLRWAEHGLMISEEKGIEKAGQGPIVVVCDESDSMRSSVDSKGRSRELWSKAVVLALCDQAKRQKRDFTYIGFSSAQQQWRKDFRGGETPIDDVIDFATHFFRGGTSYVQPLTMAHDLVVEYEHQGRVKPDIVFITDDDCSIPEDFVEKWAEAKKRLNMCVYGVQIGGLAKKVMHRLCDRVIQLENLNAGPEGMRDLFQQI